MPVWHPGFHLLGTRPVVVHPVDSERGIKFRTETRCKEPVAEEPPRSGEDEDHKLRSSQWEVMRTYRFRLYPSDHQAYVLDVVHRGPIWMVDAHSSIMGVPSSLTLRASNDLRGVG